MLRFLARALLVAALVAISAPAFAGCMKKLCPSSADFANGLTIVVNADFSSAHQGHNHVFLIQFADSRNRVLWWEEVASNGSEFKTAVPQSLDYSKIARVSVLLAGPMEEFDTASAVKRVSVVSNQPSTVTFNLKVR